MNLDEFFGSEISGDKIGALFKKNVRDTKEKGW
jgi:hypothetical protein